MLITAAGLSLIGKHAAQFKEYLAKDYQVSYCGRAHRCNYVKGDMYHCWI